MMCIENVFLKGTVAFFFDRCDRCGPIRRKILRGCSDSNMCFSVGRYFSRCVGDDDTSTRYRLSYGDTLSQRHVSQWQGIVYGVLRRMVRASRREIWS